MASHSEVGHQKNLANLGKLIDLCTQIGAPYNPNNPQITIAGLTSLQTQCTTDYNNWTAKFTTWKSATNDREVAFEPISKLCTQISDNVKTLNVPKQTMDDVLAIVHKIHGYSKELKKKNTDTTTPTGTTPGGTPNPTNPTPSPSSEKTIGTPIPLPNPIIIPTADGTSTSQQSYDSILANFDKLILDVQGIASYAPNEVNVKIVTLQALSTTLKNINLTAITATNALALARNQRNLSFYAPNTGMYDIQKKVKLYIRQIEGSTSAIYHQATALKFVKVVPGKKKKKLKK